MVSLARNLVLLALVLVGNAGFGQIVLSQSGQLPCARIVMPDNPTPSETYAAEELERWVREITGVGFGDQGKTAVFLERGNPALGEDGFRIYTDINGVHVAGGIRGILYGVYELLETYGGIGWFSPERTVIPRRCRFAIPENVDVMERPAFEMREALWFLAFDGDYAARLRLNGNAMRLQAKHGGHSHRFGGGLGNCHTFWKLVPFDEYGKTHPEYFSERNGKRVIPENAEAAKRGTQLCLTNPDVLSIVISNVFKAIRSDPSAKYFGVSQNDGQLYCECANCAAVDKEEGSHAGTLVRFVNAVAEAVEKDYPDKIIETIAYQYTRKPPMKTKLRKNTMVCLCTIECDFAHPLSSGLDAHNVSLREDIRGWASQTERLYIWDYTTDFSYFPNVFPNFNVLQDNIRFFRKHGTTSLFEQGCHMGRGAEFEALKAWIISKWMWNPDLDEKALLDRFFDGYYGKASRIVRAYFDELRSMPREDGKARMSCFADPYSQLIVPDEFLVRARRMWDAAIAEARTDDGVVLTNVMMGAFSVDFTRFMRLLCSHTMPDRFCVRRTPPFDASTADEFVSVAYRLNEMLSANKRIVLSDTYDRSIREDIRKALSVSKGVRAFTPADRVVVDEEKFVLARKGEWCFIVGDASADGGKAVKFSNSCSEWCLQLPFTVSSFDPGVRYRIRVRARIEGVVRTDPKCNVMRAGVYDFATAGSVVQLAINAGCVEDEKWKWFDVGEWIPNMNQVFWVSSGSFDKGRHQRNPGLEALYVDQVEISRVE